MKQFVLFPALPPCDAWIKQVEQSLGIQGAGRTKTYSKPILLQDRSYAVPFDDRALPHIDRLPTTTSIRLLRKRVWPET